LTAEQCCRLGFLPTAWNEETGVVYMTGGTQPAQADYKSRIASISTIENENFHRGMQTLRFVRDGRITSYEASDTFKGLYNDTRELLAKMSYLTPPLGDDSVLDRHERLLTELGNDMMFFTILRVSADSIGEGDYTVAENGFAMAEIITTYRENYLYKHL
jgi:hypothetical protein